MSYELTKGFFFFCFDGQVETSMQPVLQIIMMKSGPANIRVKMTDGLLQYNGILASHESVQNSGLDLNNPGTPIIRVNEWKYVSSQSTNLGKPYFKIERFEIVQRFAPLIKDPPVIFNGEVDNVRAWITSLGLTASGMTATNYDYAKRPKLMNESNAIPDLTPPPVLNHKSPAKPFAGMPSRNSVALNRQQFPTPNGMAGSSRTMSNSQQKDQPCAKFIMLTPFVNKFRICGVCQFKEGMRDVNTASRGTMKVLSFTLCDEDEHSMKVTAWNDLAVETDPLIVEGHTYYICATGSALRKKNERFNTTDMDYELVLGPTTELYVCADRTIPLPTLKLKRIPIASLAPSDKPVDVIGVVDKVNDITTVISKTKGELKKREIELIDDSNAKINLTLWAEKAEEWHVGEGEVISIKSALIREFMGGLSLSLSSQSRPEVMPNTEEAVRLHAWYRDNKPSGMHIASMSIQNSGSNSVEEIRTLEWAETHTCIDDYPNGVSFTARVVIEEVRRENLFYQACITCNKKVTQVDLGWHCDKCSTTMTDCETRYMMNMKISDFTGAVYTTVFGQTAADLLGIGAPELSRMAEDNFEAYNEIFKQIQFANVFIRLKVRTEYYNDQKRRKFTVVAFKDVNPEVFNAGLDATLFALENL
uniref:Replication protein A subunit n=1 Tax=Panagrellus redivivus TaxID=6233 RepID=A0A7E4VTH9_PANRE